MTEADKKTEAAKKAEAEKKASAAKKPEDAKSAAPAAASAAAKPAEAAKAAPATPTTPGKKVESGKKGDAEASKKAGKSGLFYPNRMAAILLRALEDVMGRNGLNAILNLAKLAEYIDKMPPDNLAREFDFSDFGALTAALEDMYGPRGGRGLGLRAGRATFAQGLKDFGALAGAGDLAFKVLPLPAKLKIGIPAMAKIFSTVSDQKTRVEEKDDHYLYTIEVCPVCWDRKTDKPCCHVAVGLLQEGLRWVSGGNEFRVGEIECHASGDKDCVFKIEKEPIG